jgi:hypothetical protein
MPLGFLTLAPPPWLSSSTAPRWHASLTTWLLTPAVGQASAAPCIMARRALCLHRRTMSPHNLVDKMSDTSQAYLQCRVRPPIRSKSRGLIGSRSRSTVCGGVQSLRRSSAMLAGCASHRRWPKLPSSATVAAVVVDAVGEGAGRGNASVMRDFAAPTFGA